MLNRNAIGSADKHLNAYADVSKVVVCVQTSYSISQGYYQPPSGNSEDHQLGVVQLRTGIICDNKQKGLELA